jgi:hypothetical protein
MFCTKLNTLTTKDLCAGSRHDKTLAKMAVAGRRLGVKRFRQRDDDSFSSIYVVNCMVKKERPEIKSRSVVVHSDINRVHSWRIFDTF